MPRIQPTERRLPRTASGPRQPGAAAATAPRRPDRDPTWLEAVARLRSTSLLEPTSRILRGR